METYEVVPNIISSKDLDYLSDMFNWHYGAYKSMINASDSIQDEEIKTMIERATNIFHGQMMKVLNILNEGGNSNE